MSAVLLVELHDTEDNMVTELLRHYANDVTVFDSLPGCRVVCISGDDDGADSLLAPELFLNPRIPKTFTVVKGR